MSNLQIFQLSHEGVSELEGRSIALEKSLQTLFEKNLEPLLGVRFLASEFVTGKIHGGRMDTLGIDENGCPVIIEYKRSSNENVVSQGLYYLDWLLDHRGDFELLVMKKLGTAAADEIDWSSPRLLCIAGDFTRYDVHAVRQISRNIDLIRYRKFGEDLLLVELVHRSISPTEQAAVEKIAAQPASSDSSGAPSDKGVEAMLPNTSPELRDLFHQVEAYLLALGDDVTLKKTKFYYAFRRLRNFACLEIYKAKVLMHLRLNPDTVQIEKGFTRDMRDTGHFGTGDLQITLTSAADFEKARPLFDRAYENG